MLTHQMTANCCYVAVCRRGAGPNHPRFKGYLLTLPYPGSGFIFWTWSPTGWQLVRWV